MQAEEEISEALYDAAQFGFSVEQFLNSRLGRFITDYADEKVIGYLQELKRTSPWRRRRIQWLQGQIEIWESFRERIAEAVMQGQQALKILED